MFVKIDYKLTYKPKRNGLDKVRCILVLGKEQAEIATNIETYPKNWDTKSQSILNDEPQNNLLIAFKAKVNQVIANIKLSGKHYSLQDTKKAIIGEKCVKTLLNAFDECLESNKHNYTKSNIKKWLEHRRIIVKFLDKAFKKKDLLLSELRAETAVKFKNFLFGEFGGTKYSPDYAQKAFQTINKSLKFAVMLDYLEKNPFEFLKIKGGKKSPPKFLNQEQVKKIMDKRFYDKHLERYSKLFIFQCFTGLAFCDLVALNSSHFVEFEGFTYIRILRQKTASYNAYSNIPLLPEAQEILHFFGDIENFPTKIHNQSYNRSLKDIGRICEIPIELTTHLGRKTFVNYALNVLKCDLDEVRAMIGHTDTRSLKIYGSIDIKRIHDKIQAKTA